MYHRIWTEIPFYLIKLKKNFWEQESNNWSQLKSTSMARFNHFGYSSLSKLLQNSCVIIQNIVRKMLLSRGYNCYQIFLLATDTLFIYYEQVPFCLLFVQVPSQQWNKNKRIYWTKLEHRNRTE